MTKYTQKALLVKDIQITHRRLEKTISSMTKEQMEHPGMVGDWSVKDVLAHLVEWEKLFIEWYLCEIESRMPAVQPVGMSKASIDHLNQEFYTRNRSRLLQEVLVNFQASYHEVLQIVEHISEDEMFSPGYYAWTDKWVLADYIVGNTSNHYYWANSKIKAGLKRAN